MQLINIKSGKLLPLTLAGGVLASSFSFTYGAIDRSIVNTITSSPSTNRFMQQTNENIYSELTLKAQFFNRVAAWKRNTKFMSFADQIVADENFKAIVAMGIIAVPYIIEEIEREPSPLVWSLNVILNKTISSNPNTTIEQACKLWVKSMR